ncbi:nuclear exosome regulator NRDE2-like [Branchiostoma lanceolatum]|uniref:nuclear exosome regulator NRDE2-like n=1 Tax=Branchiostoma lanceolatum TaxID=7740 RepID=UPI0034560FB0
MAESPDGDELSSARSHGVSTLFPVAEEGESVSTEGQGGLFAAYQHDQALPSAGVDRRLDWLENTSFPQAHVADLWKLQEQRLAEENRSSSSETEDSADDEPQLLKKVKTEPGSSPSSGEEYGRKGGVSYHGNKRDRAVNDGSRRQNGDSQKEDVESRTHCHKKSRHKHRHKHKHKHKHKKHKTSRDKDSSEKTVVPGDKEPAGSIKTAPAAATIWIEDAGLRPECAFRVDKKPDKENLVYGSLYRLQLANYRRFGQSCLGLGKREGIRWSEKSSKGGKKRKRGYDSRYYSEKEVAKVLNNKVTRVEIIRTGKEKPPLEVQSSHYIPLDRLSGGVKGSSLEIKGQPVYTTPTQVYIQGHTSVNETPVKQQEQGHVDEEQMEGETSEENITRLTAEYNRTLRENPHDIQAWLDFVAFQDRVMQHGPVTVYSDVEREKRKKTSLAVMEKKVAILERAIDMNPSHPQLTLQHLKLCREFWDNKKLTNQWKEFAFKYPNNPAVLREYLMFSQSHFGTFTASKVHTLYGKCISKLRAILDGTFKSHKPLPHTEEQLLELFVQQCHFLKQAGHVEKAVSSYQALIEFTCFRPSTVAENTPVSGQVEFFEPFWDSSAPRVGEDGARGWRTWQEKKEKGGWEMNVTADDDVEDADEEEEVSSQSASKSQAWLDIESGREWVHWLPWRPDTKAGEMEEDCEDPDRLVLFDDVSDSLFQLSSQAMRLQLVFHFLQFLGVRTVPLHSSHSFHTHRHFKTALEEKQTLFSTRAVHHSLGWVPVCSGAASMNSWTKSEEPKQRETKLLQKFVQNVFSQVLQVFSGAAQLQLVLAWLQHEASAVLTLQAGKDKKRLKRRSKNVRRLAKRLLKEDQNRNNLALWGAYAQLEWLLGNKEEACKVFDTALSSVGQGAAEDRLAVFELYRTYAELELGLTGGDSSVLKKTSEPLSGSETSTKALHLLCTLGEKAKFSPLSDHTVSPTRVLKARRNYQQTLEEELTSYETAGCDGADGKPPPPCASGSFLVHLTVCYGLFQYLTIGMQASAEVFDVVLSTLTRMCQTYGKEDDLFDQHRCRTFMDLELVTSAYLKLLQRHLSCSTGSLQTVRTALQGALLIFPDSPEFLKMFIELESSHRSHIAGRLRRYFDRAVQEAATPIPFLFAIQAEMRRLEMISSQSSVVVTGVSHRVRSLLERGCSSPVAQGCVLMWRWFMAFEIQQGNPAQAKAVFYRALQNCPWAKLLYMDALQWFPDDLQDVLDIMVEKEIRVRAPLEEVELLMEGEGPVMEGEGPLVEGEIPLMQGKGPLFKGEGPDG